MILPPIVLGPWTERTSLSAYDAGGRRLSPERAYAGMPADARLAAAICDAAINDRWDWVSSVLKIILGERPASTSTRTQRFLDEHGWRDIDDVYDAAHVTMAQRACFNLHLLNFTHREVAELMGLTTHAAQMQCIRSLDKLKRLMDHTTDDEEDSGD